MSSAKDRSVCGGVDVEHAVALGSVNKRAESTENTRALSKIESTPKISLNPANDPSHLYLILKRIAQALKRNQEFIEDKDDFRRILSRTELLLGSLTGPEENDLTLEVERRVELKSKLDTILATLEPVLHPQPNNADQGPKIISLMEDIRYCLADYQTFTQRSMYERERQFVTPDDLFLLNKLTRPYDDGYLSSNVQRCLRGTRTDVLRDIEGWAEDRNNVRVYWLNGVAGCGKTTIARTFADYVFAEGNMGACFFCSRNIADRSNLKFIFPTLAFELAHRSRDFRARLVQIIKSSPNVAHESLSDQLEKLIIRPLRSTGLRAIIIIDALDECKDDEPASVILSLLARRIEDIPSVKFFITGRPEPRIRSGFRLPLLRPHTDVFVLHEVNPTSVNRDIEMFLRNRLSNFAESKDDLGEVPHWPTEHDVVSLVRKSGGLFIYAETILKLIAADDSPVDRLQMIVSTPDSMTDEVSSGLDGLYNQIVQECYANSVPASVARLRLALAIVVLVFNPLSRTGLATLLDVSSSTILASLRSLHSVILVPDSNTDPICTFHKSFPDYLTDPSRCTDARFYINSGVYHAKVTIRCLELMKSQLRKNICDLPQFVMNRDVPDIHTRRRQYIGDALEYACRFWAKHLILCSGADGDDIAHILELLHDLVQRHLLAWLDVLSISEDMRCAIHSLLNVERWLIGAMVSDMDLLNSIRECRRFILYCFDSIEVSAPHIYDSLLIWPPTSSLVRALYHNQQRADTKVLSAIDTSWNACVRSIKLNHDKHVRSVGFSHNGNFITGGGGGEGDGALQIFESATGACMAMLEGHEGPVSSAAFSLDDMLLVSGSCDKTVRIWDVQTGALVATLEGHTDWVKSVAFSPSGTMVVSGADDRTIRIWNVSLGCCERVLKGHSDPVWSVCWLGINNVVSGSSDGTVRVWDISRGTCSKVFRQTWWVLSVTSSPDASKFACCSHNTINIYDSSTGTVLHNVSADGLVTSICFSPDGNQIAYGLHGGDPLVVVWDIVKKVTILKFRDSGVESVAFAPDGRCIVSGSEDGLKVWQIETRDRDEDVSDHHSMKVTCVSLNTNGQMMVSGSPDGTVRLWDVTTCSCVHTFRGHSDRVDSVAFSPDSSIVASGSRDHTIMTWSVENRNRIRTLKGHSRSVGPIAFSPDGKNIVSLSHKEMIVWDVDNGEKLAISRHKKTGHDLRVSFSADGTRIIMTKKSGHVIQGWDVIREQDPLGVRDGRRSRIETLPRILKKSRTDSCLRPVERHIISRDALLQFRHYTEDDDWVMDRYGRRVCWIPPDFRTCYSHVQGKKVALWSRSGRFVVVDISDMC